MILLDVDNEMNSLITLFYTLAITASLSATAAGGSNSETYLTTITSATIASRSVSTNVTSLSSKENTPIDDTITVSSRVTAAVAATPHTTSDAPSTTGTTETSVTTTSAATPSVTAQASSQSNYMSTSTTVPSVITHTLMSSGSVPDQGIPKSSSSSVLISSFTVKSTVTVQDTNTATTAPSVSSTTHFSSQESSASVNSAQASSTNITNSMVASMQSNVTMENTVSTAVTATISNTPMTSSYISPSLVAESMVSSLYVRSLTPEPPGSRTTVVSVNASSHFKPSYSTISPTHSPKMSSLFVLESSSSATISSVGLMSGHSPEVRESSLSLTSNQSTVSLLRETTSVMTSYSAAILTITASKVNSSSFPLVYPSPTSQAIVPTSTSSTRPTTPVEGVKTVSMEMTLDLTFKDDYRDPNSEAYKDLTTNLTRSLEKTYKNIKGYIGIRILLITKGSVVCMYIVILAKDSKADEEVLKNTLEKASKDKTFGFKVTSVKVEEEPTAKPEEKLPNWALITMIALGSLSFVFLVTVICVCVKCRRSKGENMAYGISTGELEMHTYEIIQADHGKLRAKTDGKTSTMERRIIGSHSNPTYSSNGAHADY